MPTKLLTMISSFAVAATALVASVSAQPVATDTATPADPSCFTAPDAAGLLTARGNTINTLHSYDGKLFYGYGDYNANTGSSSTPKGTNVSYLDTAAGEFKVAFPGFKTEEVNTFRTLSDGALYVPNIDPSSGARTYNGYATDAGGEWRDVGGTTRAVHIYDVARVGSTIFTAGANQGTPSGDPEQWRAVIYRSDDEGATTTESLVETPPNVTDRTGYERFYWVAELNGKVYTRAEIGGAPALKEYDPETEEWASVPDVFADGSVDKSKFGAGIYAGSSVVNYDGRLWHTRGTSLMWFDGKTTGSISLPYMINANPKISVGSDGRLYVAGYWGRVGVVERAEATGDTSPAPVVPVKRVSQVFATVDAATSTLTIKVTSSWPGSTTVPTGIVEVVTTPPGSPTVTTEVKLNRRGEGIMTVPASSSAGTYSVAALYEGDSAHLPGTGIGTFKATKVFTGVTPAGGNYVVTSDGMPEASVQELSAVTEHDGKIWYSTAGDPKICSMPIP